MNKILVIGDSWSSAVVAGNPASGGWPEMIGIPAEMRQAVAGSTAAQWAADFEGRLTKAINTPSDIVILSLLGNDLRAALADGTLTLFELNMAIGSFRHVLHRIVEDRRRVLVMLYADPSGGDRRMAVAVALLNQTIRASVIGVDFRIHTLPLGFALGNVDFRRGDGLHANQAGHEHIASFIKEELENDYGF